ncbi:MAG: S8 family serine peptidase [Bacteroidota bacterium]
MRKIVRGLLFTLFLGSSLHSVLGQSLNRYFVYFSDKNASQQTFSLGQPSDFLSQKALDRRSKESIVLDSTDLPVSQQYIDALKDQNFSVFFSSNWFNGVLLQASEIQADGLNDLDFVDSVRLVAKGSRLVENPQIPNAPESFESPKEVYGDTEIQLKMLGAELMHQDGIKGNGTLLAVFDNGFTGVNRYSPFEQLWNKDQIKYTKDFVENSGDVFQFGSHGTSVLSTIGASFSNDTMQYNGIATESDFVLCVTEDNQGENTIEEYNWVFAAEYADSLGVDIINSSLGYRTFDIDEHDYTTDDLDGNTSIITKAAELAARKGIVVVTSAGNSGRRVSPQNLISHPGDADSILVVGSVDPNFQRSDFSSVGPTTDGRIKPDVCAFGNGTALVRGNGDIERGGGTSFAAPLIAGFAAGILQANPGWGSQQLISAIKNSGHNSNPNSQIGHGVPNYTYAVNGSIRVLQIDDILAQKVTVYPNPFSGNELKIRSKSSLKSKLQVEVMDSNGQVLYREEYGKKELKNELVLKLDSVQPGLYYLILQTKESRNVVKLINF